MKSAEAKGLARMIPPMRVGAEGGHWLHVRNMHVSRLNQLQLEGSLAVLYLLPIRSRNHWIPPKEYVADHPRCPNP